MGRSAGPVRRAKPFGHDALAAKRAGVLEYHRAVLAIGLIERDASVCQAQQPSQPAFTVLDGLLSNILAIHFQQIERAYDRPSVPAEAPDQVEHRKPAVVANNRFGVDNTRAHRERSNGFGGEREAIGEIVAIPADQADSAALPIGKDTKAVVLISCIQPDPAGGAGLRGDVSLSYPQSVINLSKFTAYGP